MCQGRWKNNLPSLSSVRLTKNTNIHFMYFSCLMQREPLAISSCCASTDKCFSVRSTQIVRGHKSVHVRGVELYHMGQQSTLGTCNTNDAR